jgi:hypothetical protein
MNVSVLWSSTANGNTCGVLSQVKSDIRAYAVQTIPLADDKEKYTEKEELSLGQQYRKTDSGHFATPRPVSKSTHIFTAHNTLY